jgi:alkylhydroperoxidase family enzyme
MTWIKTISPAEDEKVKRAMEAQRELYPIEYATPVHPTPDGASSGIVESHSLIPDALFHAFATFGALMSPDLPLTRRQHEMITTLVSVNNRCHY